VRTTELWIPTTDLPLASSRPFYRRLNEALRLGDFDTFVKRACQKFYAGRMGRPSLPPAVYFRLLLIGYFEGLDSDALVSREIDLETGTSPRTPVRISFYAAATDRSYLSATRRGTYSAFAGVNSPHD
jgi:transposase